MQPQAYNRETDFTDRTGDDTDNSAINTEFDAAATSINQLRENLELIQGDDGQLVRGIVTADSLDNSVYKAIGSVVNSSVVDAQTAAISANNAAVSANAARDAASSAKNASEALKSAYLLNANNALQSATAAETSKNIALSSAATAVSKASEASTSASNASSSAKAALTAATNSESSAARSENATQSALAVYGGIATINNAVAFASAKATEANSSAAAASASVASILASEANASASAIRAAESAVASQGGAATAFEAALHSGLLLNAIQEIVSLTAAKAAYPLLGSSIMKTGSIFATAEYGIPENTTLTNGVTKVDITVKDPTGVRFPQSSIHLGWGGQPPAGPTFTAFSGVAAPIGSRNADHVYVVAGSSVDASGLSSGSDVVYLTGAWADYSKSFTTETATFSRIVNGAFERVRVSARLSTTGNDRLVFADGSVMSNDARLAITANINCTLDSIPGYDATTKTPPVPPSNFLYVDTFMPTDVLQCNGSAVSRSAYPALFARIGTLFGAGDGTTTFNLPNIPPVAAGIPYYIKA